MIALRESFEDCGLRIANLRGCALLRSAPRVRSLPPDTLVFCSSIFRDGAGSRQADVTDGTGTLR